MHVCNEYRNLAGEKVEDLDDVWEHSDIHMPNIHYNYRNTKYQNTH